MMSTSFLCMTFMLLMELRCQAGIVKDPNGKIVDKNGTNNVAINGTQIQNGTSGQGQNETIPRKMSEGRLISTLFNLGLTTLNDYAQEAKYLQELQKNRTNLTQLFKNKTAANVTHREYQTRYFHRYGYDDYGYHHHGGFGSSMIPMPMPIFIPIGGNGGYGGYGGRSYGFHGGSYRPASYVIGGHNTNYGYGNGYRPPPARVQIIPGPYNNLNKESGVKPPGPKMGWNIPPYSPTNNLNAGGTAGGAKRPVTNMGWNIPPQSGAHSGTGSGHDANAHKNYGWNVPGMNGKSGSESKPSYGWNMPAANTKTGSIKNSGTASKPSSGWKSFFSGSSHSSGGSSRKGFSFGRRGGGFGFRGFGRRG